MTTAVSLISDRVSEALFFLAFVTAGMVLVGYLADRLTAGGTAKRRVWRATMVVLAVACALELFGLNSAVKWTLPAIDLETGHMESHLSLIAREFNYAAGSHSQESWHIAEGDQSIERAFDLDMAVPSSTGEIIAEFGPSSPSEQQLANDTQNNLTPIDEYVRSPLARRSVSPPQARSPVSAWLGGIWCLGSFALISRHAVRCWRLNRVNRTMPVSTDAELSLRIEQLGQRLNAPRVVVRQGSIPAPMACGVVCPLLLIPETFACDYERPQQDAILAHELAHLASRDPKWQLFALHVAAFLWWHPCVWFALRRNHLSMEFAADEAAVNVPQGPSHLAECLVALGRQISKQQRWQLGMAGPGFRSALGTRVERLLALGGDATKTRPRGRAYGVCEMSLLLVMFVCVLGPGWALPRHSSYYATSGGSKMQLLKQSWTNSIAITLAASLLAPLSSSAQDPVVEVAEEVEFVLDDEDRDRDADRDRDDDAVFTPDTERRERTIRRTVRRSRNESGDDEDRNAFEDGSRRPEIAGERPGLNRREQQLLRQRSQAIRERIETLAEREGSRDERERLEHELAHLEEQIARRNFGHGNHWQPQIAQRVASRSRRAHIQAAIANLRAAGLHDHAAKLAEELRESREAANRRERPERGSSDPFGNLGNQAGWWRSAHPFPSAIRPVPAPSANQPAPAPQVENLRQQVESMHAEMAEIRQMLQRLMQRQSEDRD